MVTLYLNDIPVLIPSEVFADEIRKALPDLLTIDANHEMSAKEKAARLGMKVGVRGMLGLIGSEMKRTGSPLPRPVSRLEPGQDWLEYGIGYMLNLVLALVESRAWPFECADTADGIEVLGLAKHADAEAPGMAPPLALPAPTIEEDAPDLASAGV